MESKKIWAERYVASSMTGNLAEPETPTPYNEEGSYRLKIVQVKHLAPCT